MFKSGIGISHTELEKLDINSLTPLEALTKLYELQKKAREG